MQGGVPGLLCGRFGIQLLLQSGILSRHSLSRRGGWHLVVVVDRASTNLVPVVVGIVVRGVVD